MPPQAPAFGTLRLASPRDILRIGIVAACGFRYSPVFDWERPYHEKYPQDTLLSYRQEFTDVIKGEQYVVLVAEDKYDPHEAQKSKAILPEDDTLPVPSAGDNVVVGVGCWKLEPHSPRIGQFQNNSGTYPHLPKNMNRDKNLTHAALFGEKAEEAEKKFFHGFSTMEMVVVHPAYWHRGHGSTLVKWGMNLSNMDRITQGVIAAKMGTKLYKELGYKHLEDITFEGDEDTPKGLSVAIMEYDFKKEKLQDGSEGRLGALIG